MAGPGSEPGTPATLVSSTTEPLSLISMVHIALTTTKFYMYLFQIDIVNIKCNRPKVSVELSIVEHLNLVTWMILTDELYIYTFVIILQ